MNMENSSVYINIYIFFFDEKSGGSGISLVPKTCVLGFSWRISSTRPCIQCVILKDLVGSVPALGDGYGWGASILNKIVCMHSHFKITIPNGIHILEKTLKKKKKNRPWRINSALGVGRSWLVVYLMSFHTSKARWEAWEYSHRTSGKTCLKF